MKTTVVAAFALALHPCSLTWAEEKKPETKDADCCLEPTGRSKEKLGGILKLIRGLEEDFQKQEKECREMQTRQQRQTAEMERQKEALKQQLVTLTNERDAVRKAAGEMQNRLRTELANLQQKHAQEQAVATAALEKSRAEMERLNIEAKALRETAAGMAAKLQEGSALAAEQQKAKVNLEQQLAAAAQKQTADQALIGKLETGLAEQKTTTGQIQAAHKVLEQAMTNMVPRTKAEALAARLAEAGTLKAKLTMERDDLTGRLQQANAQMTKGEQIVNTLTNRATELVQAVTTAKEAATALETKMNTETARLQKVNEGLTGDLKTATQRFNDADAASKKLAAEMEARQLRHDEAGKSLQAKLDQQTKLGADQAAAIQKFQQESLAWNQRQESFESELASARESLNSAQTELNKARTRMIDSPENRIAPVYYDAGSEDNAAELERVLTDARRVLSRLPDARFTIIGYASEDGSFEANMRLSARRAEKIGLHLQGNGIPSDRITLTAAGSTRSMAAESIAGRRLSRRVEVLVEPAGAR